MNEKKIIQMIAKPIENITSDYKAFFKSRAAINRVEYRAELTVVAPLENGGDILRALHKLASRLTFKSSQVETDENRGVDVLTFETTLRYDGRYDERPNTDGGDA
ncbi:MAG: hypothetical protein LBU73_04865 [Helicobacteraceae bacterium]|jgi:hypothetical protein|nr:hypothetical protein [Helicobacteraceae bacterium]